MIAGKVKPDSGHIEFGPTVVVGYFDQEGRPLNDKLRGDRYRYGDSRERENS